MDGFYFHHQSMEGDPKHHTLWPRARVFCQCQACLGFGVFPLGCINGEGTGKCWREARNQLHGDGWEKQGEV